MKKGLSVLLAVLLLALLAMPCMAEGNDDICPATNEPHSWYQWGTMVAPTIHSTGVMRYKCRNCDATKDEEIPKRDAQVRYTLYGGTNHPDNPQTISEGMRVTLKDPTRTGYTFLGWYTSAAMTERVTVVECTDDYIYLHAKWRKNEAEHKYTQICPDTDVSYNYTHLTRSESTTFNKYGFSSADDSVAAVSLSRPSISSKYNYESGLLVSVSNFLILNFSTHGEGETAADLIYNGETVVVIHVIVAHDWGDWETVTEATDTKTGLKRHTCKKCEKTEEEVIPRLSSDIIYKLNGGTNHADNPAMVRVGQTVTLKNPSRKGYTFKAWCTDKDLTKTITKVTGGKKVTVYAKWAANQYTVKFNGNGAKSGSMDSMSMKYDAEKKLTANAFERTGYKFTGWNTKKDGSGTAYANKAAVKNLTTKSGATVTLYAQWKLIKYKVSFDGNGATSGSTKTMSLEYGTAKALTGNGFKRTGYQFTGWNTKKNGSGKAYANKASVKNLSTTDGATVTLFAQWKANSYTVKFKGNGSTSGSMNPLSMKYGSSAKLPANAFKRSGYKFVGWNTKADGTGTSYSNKASVKDLTSKDGATVTLYAQWKKK